LRKSDTREQDSTAQIVGFVMNNVSQTALRFAILFALGASTCASAQPAPPHGASGAASSATKPGGPAATQSVPLVMEPKAMEIIKAMGDRLAAAKTMSFTATVGYEFPSQLGPPLVYTTEYDVTMQRPDKLRVIMPGDGPRSEFYYDGKTMVAYAPVENLVAVTDAPPTIDEALKKAFQKAAIFYPFTDLLVDNPGTVLAETGKLAFYIGQSNIGGIKTNMVAWANDDVFLQAWVGVDDKLPYRVRATYSADPLRLRHDLVLSNWKLDEAVTADMFTSTNALGAHKIDFDRPEARLPAGVKPITLSKPSSKRSPIPLPSR
jgi:hypothetical protein